MERTNTIDLGIMGRMAEMLADLRLRMQDKGVTPDEVAALCGLNPQLVNSYLTGEAEPSMGDLAKMAEAAGYVWRLVESPQVAAG